MPGQRFRSLMFFSFLRFFFSSPLDNRRLSNQVAFNGQNIGALDVLTKVHAPRNGITWHWTRLYNSFLSNRTWACWPCCVKAVGGLMSLFVQPPPGTFGGTNGLGGADGFGGTGENNVMYAGLTLILFVCVAGFMPLNSAKTSICHTLIYRTSLQALRKQRLTRCLGLLYRQMPAKLAHRSGLGSVLHRPNILSKTTHVCACACAFAVWYTLYLGVMTVHVWEKDR